MDFASLQHSVFLQALGSAILNSLWQGFILWLIYETVIISLKNASSRFKNNFSTILLFFSFLWFVINFVSGFINKENIIANDTLSAGFAAVPVIRTFSGFEKLVTYAISSLPYLSIAYIFLLLFLMAKLFTAYRHVYIVSNKQLVKVPFELQFFASNVAQQMGITKKIGVWISRRIDVPATIGFIKPLILIPVASINNLSRHQLEAIILHELSHIKRNDYLINLIISVIETILFFNPFVALLSNVMKRERENCCDDFVLQYQYDPYTYASALLRLEQSRVNNLKLAMGAVSGKKQLLSRIKRITSNHSVSRQFNYGQKLLALILVTGIICSVAWLSPQQKKSIGIEKKQVIYVEKIDPKFAGRPDSTNFNQGENLQVKILKHSIIKNDKAVLPDLDPVKISPQKNLEIKDKSNADFWFKEGDEDPTESDILKQSLSFFHEQNLQLPKSIHIKNFPFQKMDFNIDMSKIDMKEINENLKKAYKEINALDWDKVQNDINLGFSQLNNISTKEKLIARSDFQKMQVLAQLEKAQNQYNKKFLTDNIKKGIEALNNSLLLSETYDAAERNELLQEKFGKIQQQYADTLKNNFHFYLQDPQENNNEKSKPFNKSPNKNIEQKNSKLL